MSQNMEDLLKEKTIVYKVASLADYSYKVYS